MIKLFTLKRIILHPRPLSYHAIVMAIIIMTTSASLYLKPMLQISKRYDHALRTNQQLKTSRQSFEDSLQQCIDTQRNFNHINLSLPIAMQAFSPTSQDTNDLITHAFKHHHLTLISFQPISNQNHSSRYLACGSFYDIQRLMTVWNTDTFLGWITELVIEPCPNQSGSLQLSLLLEKSLEKNN